MTTISSKTFLENPNHFFDLARREDIAVKRGKSMFQLVYKPAVEEQTYLCVDDDLRNAITMGELRDSALEFIDKLYAGK